MYSNISYIIIAFIVLALGMSVYLTDRQGAYFVPSFIKLYANKGSLFGYAGNWIPSITHSFSFTLLSLLILRPSVKMGYLICLFWLIIECIFEIGQIPIIAANIVETLPFFFYKIPILEIVPEFFYYGTFDPMDIVAVVLGVLTALFIIRNRF